MDWQQHTVIHQELELAVQEHGAASAPVILALHGWRDNSASFKLLAELLPEFRLLALDFPGHGLSSCRPRQADYAIWSYLADVEAVADKLLDGPFILMGHSMGGAVATLFAALFPERVNKLVLLDAVGPLVTAPLDVPTQMRQAMQALKALKPGFRNRYGSFASAVAARASKGLSDAAAELLAQRGVAQDDKGYYWQLDPRLSMKNMLSLSEEQAAAFISQIACPTLLVAARQYWSHRQAWFEQRLSRFPQLESHILEGGHHQHMEAEAGHVAELVRTFLE